MCQLLILTALSSALLPFTLAGKVCNDVEFSVTISATAVQVPTSLTLDSLLSFFALQLESLINVPISGSYTILGTHCRSTITNQHTNGVLQFMNHGIEGTRHEWSGLDGDGYLPYHGSNYSYVDFVTDLGYDSLAIDRLGNGLSDHPDPLLVVQLPAQIEVTHAIIEHIKSGYLGTTYNETVYVGQSFGSILGHALATKYPYDVDRMILNGWSNMVTNSSVATIVDLDLIPATLVNSSTFGNLSVGYLAATNETGFEKIDFYGGAAGGYYDPGTARQDFSQIGTVTLGEVYTLALFNSVQAMEFSGKVLVIDGQYDGFFCGTDFFLDNPNCGSGESSIPAQSSDAFPSAQFDYHIAPNTGHAIQYHYTQKDSFMKAHQWLLSTT